MKKVMVFFAFVLVLSLSQLPAQGTENPAFKVIVNHFAARNFSNEQVSKAELDLVIQAGVRAPSAANRQPWHFTVVQDEALAKQIIPQVNPGNVLIVVSAAGDGKTNGAAILDCALATQSLYLAAQALGLGSRIYTGPIDNVNRSFKTILGLPNDHSAVAIVRIGRLPAGVDAVSSASARNEAGRMVSYK